MSQIYSLVKRAILDNTLDSIVDDDLIETLEKADDMYFNGEESFLDHVHPTIEGHRLLAQSLVHFQFHSYFPFRFGFG